MAFNLGVASGSININTSGLKNADLALRSAGTSMIDLGRQAIDAFGTVVGAAAKFEKEMDFVQAVSGASAAEMDTLRQAAIDLAKDSIYGPIALSESFVELIKAGASAKDIIDGVGAAAVSLGQAADVTVPFAGENLLNILNTFKLGAGDAQHVADLLAGAANASSVELSDLVISMKYAGPVAQGLGIDIEDLNGALTVLGKVGIKGSTAGTSLRAIMLNLSPATKSAEKALTKLGIITEDGSNQFFDSAGNAKSLSEVFDILGKATSGLTAQAKTDLLRDIFGVRAIPAALELMSQGADGFQALQDEINKTTATEVAAKRIDNLDGSVKRLKATLEAIFVTAGGPFQNMLKGFVDGLRNFLNFVDRLPGPLKTLFLGGLAVFGVLSILAGGFLLTVGNMVRTVRVFGELANAFKTIIPLISQAIGLVVRLTIALLTNPIVLAIVAVVALAVGFYLLYTRVKEFRDFIDGVWQSMQAGWDGVLKGFGGLYDGIIGFFDGVKKAVDSFIGGFTNPFAQLGDSVKGVDRFFIEAGAGIKRALIGIADGFKAIPGQIVGVGKAIGGFFSSVGGFFGDLPGIVGRALASLAGTIGRFFTSLPGLIGGAFVSIGTSAVNAISELGPAFAREIGFIIGRAIRLSIELPILFAKGFVGILLKVAEFFGNLIPLFFQGLASVASFIGKWFIKIQVEAVKWGFNMGLAFVKWIPGALLAIGAALLKIFDVLFQFFVSAVGLAYDIGSGIVSGIINALFALPGQVFSIMAQVLGFLGTAGLQIISTMADIGSQAVGAILSFFIELPGQIVGLMVDAVKAMAGFVTEFFNKAKEIGSNIWNGFKEGLFGSPHTKIEYAMWDMEANMRASMNNVGKNIKSLQGMQSRIPTMNAGTLGISSPANAALTANGGGTTWEQNSPLVGTAYIRNDKDIVSLARELDRERSTQERAKGRKAAPAYA